MLDSAVGAKKYRKYWLTPSPTITEPMTPTARRNVFPAPSVFFMPTPP